MLAVKYFLALSSCRSLLQESLRRLHADCGISADAGVHTDDDDAEGCDGDDADGGS